MEGIAELVLDDKEISAVKRRATRRSRPFYVLSGVLLGSGAALCGAGALMSFANGVESVAMMHGTPGTPGAIEVPIGTEVPDRWLRAGALLLAAGGVTIGTTHLLQERAPELVAHRAVKNIDPTDIPPPLSRAEE